MSVIIALIVFGMIVLVHEFGHFYAARKCGIFVEEFAIGMGPKLFGIKRGDTLYSIRILPLGGFCKMMGEDEGSSDQRAFNNKTVAQRIIVISAGVIMNFLLALVIFTALSMYNGFLVPVISEVSKGSPAMEAGLQEGDRITHINGTKVNIFEDLSVDIRGSNGKDIVLKFTRDGQKYEKTIVPTLNEEGSYVVGIGSTLKTGVFSPSIDGYEKATFLESVQNGFWKILFWIKQIILGLVKLFTLGLSKDDIAGPLGIVGAIGDTYNASVKEGAIIALLNMAQFTAILSANLGVFNLLPLPALDGGRLVFLIIEGIRRKPINPEKEGVVHLVGFVLLMALALFVTYNDIMKIIL